MPGTPFVVVTNFNRNFTGVSATAAAVLRKQAQEMDVAACGYQLPGCPQPVSRREAIKLSRAAIGAGRTAIWHVRRNSEMQTAILVRDVLRVPIKIVFTSAAQRRHSLFPRWLISRMDAVIATTARAASFVPHVQAIAPHGVDTDAFHPVDPRASAWARSGFPGARGIATVGRIRPEKGTDRFVDAMIALLPGVPDVTALVIGATSAEFAGFDRELRRRADAACLSQRILFPGEISPERMRTIYPGLSALVALPRYEGYGVTPLEAMASGTPVILSDTGNFREFVGDGAAGRIVGGDDAREAAATLEKLLGDERSIDGMGRQARARAVDLFSLDSEVKTIGAVYDRLAS